jgi:methylmalonyl-CoA mutase N-terminal domain/subunit
MMSIQSRIPRVKKAGYLPLVLPLIPYKNSSVKEDKGRYIAFELKTRVGHASDATKYKKLVTKFECSPDRASTVRALIRGESAVEFETALQDVRLTTEGETVPISTDYVQEALKAVTETVFPHRAMETRRLWMNRKMFKPVELTTRQIAASISRLNNSLPFFPNATESSKFLEVELIGLLE